MSGEVHARRLMLCLWIALLASVAIAFWEQGSGQQTFATFGQAKRYALPLMYALFFIAWIVPAPARLSRHGGTPKMPSWAWLPAVGILVSFVPEALIASVSTQLSTLDLLQGLALFLGFTLMAGYGIRADNWSETHRSRLLMTLFAAALGAGLMGANGLTPFVALTVPGCFAAVLLAFRLRGKRPRYAILAVILAVLTLRNLEPTSQQPTSDAVLGQIAVCGALLVMLMVPRAFRPGVIVLAIATALWYFVKVNGLALLQGRYFSSDVTIAQRSYEANVVNSTIGEHLGSILFGLGPGATLNLTASPDAGTLSASGRNLAAVDDVHLLSAYLILKLGIVGLVWAMLLFIAIWRVTVAYLRSTGSEAAWGLALLMFVVAGAVNALPAATNLLVNPLVPLLLAVLWTNASTIGSGWPHALGVISVKGRPLGEGDQHFRPTESGASEFAMGGYAGMTLCIPANGRNVMADTKPLREFFYVDVDRTRSLLAQLQDGVGKSLTSEKFSTSESAASASLFGIDGSGGYSRGMTLREPRSFQEMIFVAFETLADSDGLVTDLGDEFKSVRAWEAGQVHGKLQEGQLIRMRCDVQILDGKLFVERLGRFKLMAESIVSVMHDATPKHSTPQQRKQITAAAVAAVMGGVELEQMQGMGSFVDAFVGDSIAFRALACGRDHLELGFGGSLLGRREYIQEERESLFSRYGTFASNWTCVMQVAAIPSQVEPDTGERLDKTVEALLVPDDEAGADDGSGGAISRAAMESLALGLLTVMEEKGIVEGSRWPTVSVTPLAVYRAIPRGFAAKVN